MKGLNYAKTYIFMIKLPYFHQKKDYTCGPASLRMVFNFFGLKTNEEEVKLPTTAELWGF